jgi:hypothetical protein
MSKSELAALEAVDFSWTVHLKSVWEDIGYDVRSHNIAIRNDILKDINQLAKAASPLSPLGRILIGPAGSGKTHLLAMIRKRMAEAGLHFVLVDMTDVHDFWETVLQGFVNSLGQDFANARPQYHLLLEKLVKRVMPPLEAETTVLRQISRPQREQVGFAKRLIHALAGKHPQEMHRFQDVIKALVFLNAELFEVADIGHGWLQGIGIEEADRVDYGFKTARCQPKEIVQGLSWLMGLSGPSVLALDQMDAIVTQYDLIGGAAEEKVTDEQRVAASIIHGISGGIMALRDVTYRSVILIACLESTWDILRQKTLPSSQGRYKSPSLLTAVNKTPIAEAMICSRLQNAFRTLGFKSSHSTWPFKKSAFATIRGLYPRQILQRCEHHRENCLREQRVWELETFNDNGAAIPNGHRQDFFELERCFEALKESVQPEELLAEENEDQLGAILQTACRLLLKEMPSLDEIDLVLEANPSVHGKAAPLHARVRFIHRTEGDRETHVCLKAIQKTHANAYRPRLKAAITESGIDKALSFRHLVVIRSTVLPSGEATRKLTDLFIRQGGRFISPPTPELAIILALQQMEAEQTQDFQAWLMQRRPVSTLSFIRDVFPLRYLEDSPDGPSTDAVPPADSRRSESDPPREKIDPPDISPVNKSARYRAQSGKAPPFSLPIGNRLMAGKQGEALTIPAANLTQHFAILAGSGSGKTVLIRRLIEEAALLSIPAIIIDGAGDLCRLGDPWPSPPDGWHPDDPQKAARYHQHTEVVIWTPGIERGNPMILDPIPDFSAIANDIDELGQAVAMTREALQEIVAPGASTLAQNKVGVLSAALEYFARQYGMRGLPSFVELLEDLPMEAGAGISQAHKLAGQMADSLKAQIQIDVLLKQSGSALDPAELFGLQNPTSKTRISVISLVGLPASEQRNQFLNRLAMTLFSWIKKHPKTIRGLLVLDEAGDFVPSGKSTACKNSLIRLVSQARKYGLGMVFATQAPKSIDHTIITNCATQFYGRAASPAAIDVIQGQIRQRGGNGADVSRLGPGIFYAHTENLKAPIKLSIPNCLSYHPPTPPTDDEILNQARRFNEIRALSV